MKKTVCLAALCLVMMSAGSVAAVARTGALGIPDEGAGVSGAEASAFSTGARRDGASVILTGEGSWAEFELSVLHSGIYEMALDSTGRAGAVKVLRVEVDGPSLPATLQATGSAGSAPASCEPVSVFLREGVQTLRLTASSPGEWRITGFSLTRIDLIASGLLVQEVQAGSAVNGEPALVRAVISSGVRIPQGQVAFYVDGVFAGDASLDAQGQAVFATDTLKAGEHVIQALYKGNGNYAPCLSPECTLTAARGHIPVPEDLASLTVRGVYGDTLADIPLPDRMRWLCPSGPAWMGDDGESLRTALYNPDPLLYEDSLVAVRVTAEPRAITVQPESALVRPDTQAGEGPLQVVEGSMLEGDSLTASFVFVLLDDGFLEILAKDPPALPGYDVTFIPGRVRIEPSARMEDFVRVISSVNMEAFSLRDADLMVSAYRIFTEFTPLERLCTPEAVMNGFERCLLKAGEVNRSSGLLKTWDPNLPWNVRILARETVFPQTHAGLPGLLTPGDGARLILVSMTDTLTGKAWECPEGLLTRFTDESMPSGAAAFLQDTGMEILPPEAAGGELASLTVKKGGLYLITASSSRRLEEVKSSLASLAAAEPEAPEVLAMPFVTLGTLLAVFAFAAVLRRSKSRRLMRGFATNAPNISVSRRRIASSAVSRRLEDKPGVKLLN